MLAWVNWLAKVAKYDAVAADDSFDRIIIGCGEAPNQMAAKHALVME